MQTAYIRQPKRTAKETNELFSVRGEAQLTPTEVFALLSSARSERTGHFRRRFNRPIKELAKWQKKKKKAGVQMLAVSELATGWGADEATESPRQQAPGVQ